MEQNPNIDWQGHRGCRGIMPENSMQAFEKALELSGCKGLNVRITKSLTRSNEVTEYSIDWN